MTIYPYIPYTYLIGWTYHNKFYYGVKWCKNSNPNGFWVNYFTSSKYVKKFREEYGEPDLKLVIPHASAEAAINSEIEFHNLYGVRDNDIFLNKANSSDYFAFNMINVLDIRSNKNVRISNHEFNENRNFYKTSNQKFYVDSQNKFTLDKSIAKKHVVYCKYTGKMFKISINLIEFLNKDSYLWHKPKAIKCIDRSDNSITYVSMYSLKSTTRYVKCNGRLKNAHKIKILSKYS